MHCFVSEVEDISSVLWEVITTIPFIERNNVSFVLLENNVCLLRTAYKRTNIATENWQISVFDLSFINLLKPKLV
jgi:hypothetical protein